jgi:hypothetical protein
VTADPDRTPAADPPELNSKATDPAAFVWDVPLGGDRPADGCVGPYKILGSLGRGGMGSVLRVEDPGGRPLALKVIGQDCPSPQALARFRREGELTAALRHPNVVAIHDAGEHRGKPYLVYELVEGRSLAEAMPTLSREQRLDAVAAAAAGLAHAHTKGVVHRDLKGENVLLAEDGPARVADFGLAYGADLEQLTRTGAMVGTPHSMSPEQATGNRAAYGPPTDVWALGVLLYQALTDQDPFQGETLTALLVAISRGRPPAPRSLDATISPDLSAVCLQALARRPEDRYPDAGAFAADLARARAGERVASTGGGRRAAQLLLALLGIAAALLGIVFGHLLPRRSAGEALEAHRRWEREALAPLALTVLDQGDLDPADLAARRERLADAAAFFPDEAGPHLALLDAHLRLAGGSYGSSEDGLDPKDPVLATAEALLRLRQGDARGARTRLERVLRRDPEFRPARLALVATRPPQAWIDAAAEGDPDSRALLAARWEGLLPPLVEGAVTSAEHAQRTARLAGCLPPQSGPSWSPAVAAGLEATSDRWAEALTAGLAAAKGDEVIDRLEAVLATAKPAQAPATTRAMGQALEESSLASADRSPAHALAIIRAEFRLHYLLDGFPSPSNHADVLRRGYTTQEDESPEVRLAFALSVLRCVGEVPLSVAARAVADTALLEAWIAEHPTSRAGPLLLATKLRYLAARDDAVAERTLALLKSATSAPRHDLRPIHQGEAWLHFAQAHLAGLRSLPADRRSPDPELLAALRAARRLGVPSPLIQGQAIEAEQQAIALTEGLEAGLEAWPASLEAFEAWTERAGVPRDVADGTPARERARLLNAYAQDLRAASSLDRACEVQLRAFDEVLRYDPKFGSAEGGWEAMGLQIAASLARTLFEAGRARALVEHLGPHTDALLASRRFGHAADAVGYLILALRQLGEEHRAQGLIRRGRAAFPNHPAFAAERAPGQ